MQVSDASGRVLARLLEERTGQQLTVSRRWRIETALKSLMRDRGFDSLDQLAFQLQGRSQSALAGEVVEALINNETFFFRDRPAFELLLKGALPRLQRAREHRKRLKIWCAGCSTGQEAYSLAMAFAEERLRWQDWKIDIVATDVSATAIEQARAGVYSQFEVQRGLPVLQMIRWFEEEGTQQWRIARQLRESVSFQVHNLAAGEPPAQAPFDIILCRNVLLYFPPATGQAVLGRLARASAPDACLMLGAGETVIGQSEDFVSDPENRGLYIRKAPAEAPAPLRSFG